MNKELDIRPLMVNNLKHDETGYNYKIKSLLNEDKYFLRPFNDGYTWNHKKATYFIESLILGCEVHPFIMFESHDKYYICDGINRYMTIKKFVNNELRLTDNGLTKLKWLADKKFKDLKETEQNYFLHNIYMSYIVYHYENKMDPFKQITKEEELAIQKQLYVRYNSGIRLAIEELQRAQFQGEYLTERFREKLESDTEYKEILKNLYIGKRIQSRNEIDCMLVDIRYLLASTYANIRAYCLCRDKNKRINVYYEDALSHKPDQEKEEMFQDFNLCIDCLKKIFRLPEWEKYEVLHNRYFIHTLYWAISVIRRDREYPISKIDLKTLIEYFGKSEEEYIKFLNSEAHHHKLMIERYLEMAKYFKKYYGQDLTKEFERTTPKKTSKTQKKIDVQQVHYRRLPHTLTVSEMLDNLKTFRYNVRPEYQRLESLNIDAASRILESMLVDIQIPPILTFQKIVDGETVFEVIDGQQRLLSLVGYMNSTYKNEHGEECKSEKEGYALSGLDIYYELNGSTYNLVKNRSLLAKEYQKKILDTKLYVVNIIENDEKEARDHFVRLNSNITPLGHDFFYWNAIGDQILLNAIFDVVKNNHEAILGTNNIKMVNEKYVTALACLLSELQNPDYHLKTALPLSKVTHWLQDFNKLKQQCFYKNEEKINVERTKYLNMIYAADQFLTKIELWLNYIGKDIKDIFRIKNNTRVAVKNIVCLAQLLYHISLEDMKKHSQELETMLIEFYDIIHRREVDVVLEIQYLKMYQEKINMLDSNLEHDIYEKMKHTVPE